MRVALVCPYDLSAPGGVQSHVEALARELRAAGDDVLVVGPADGDPGGWARAVGGSLRVPFNDSVAPIAWSPRSAVRSLRAIREHDPDVVHVHEPAVPTLGLTAAVRAPRPLVATFHAWSDRDRVYRAARPVLSRLLARLDRRIAVSRPAARYHADALGWPVAAFTEIPNGVHVSRFASAEPIPDDDGERPTLLFVGRLEPRKGLEQLVRAFLQVKSEHPAVRLLVVGDGPERDRCQQLLPPTLRPDVSFVGRVEPEDLPRFHAAADLFVAPALGGESFGIVLLEAMAAGVPVVGSAIPGYASVIRDGRDGVLVRPGDPRALAAAIDELLRSPARRRALAAAAREAVADYDWPVIAARIRDCYVDVTGGAA